MQQNGEAYPCWLRHARLEEGMLTEQYRMLAHNLQVIEASCAIVQTAIAELTSGLYALLGIQPVVVGGARRPEKGIILTIDQEPEHPDGDSPRTGAGWALYPEHDGYRIQWLPLAGRQTDEASASGQLVITGRSGKGLLYGVFHLLRLIQAGHLPHELDISEQPANGLRLINHWDNMDGSIERGYAGQSIFFRKSGLAEDLTRIEDYARLMASIGINAIAINNVNVHQLETRLITKQFLPDVARVAAVFRRYGITLLLSVNYTAPLEIGGLDTADPLNEHVRQWWKRTTAEVYTAIPDFGGFLVKADSEGRPGPYTYGRNHADGANMLAEAVAPYDGIVIWRCFVYNCLQDWRDRQTDRARAAYDHFTPLDGQFHERVILQIKNGPMDFQVREPVSPLFGAMPATNHLLELQITQEYTGQQRHLCYLVPQWREVLEFDTYARGAGSTVAEAVSGHLYDRPLGGMTAVSNVGDDDCWTGHILAQANLHGYGRLAWNPKLTAEQLAKEWIELTFGRDEIVLETISEMLLSSWSIYEQYTAPLGVGWMVNPANHYGPNVDGYEYSRWGTYHFADCHGIGVDRTSRTGTGYTSQYREPHALIYEDPAQCPDELLLFFHHMPYTHQLQSGKTIIQHIYDTHFSGAEQATELVRKWKQLQGKIDEVRFRQVLGRLEEQAEHAKEWRDQINTYFYRKSGIADEQGRVIY